VGLRLLLRQRTHEVGEFGAVESPGPIRQFFRVRNTCDFRKMSSSILNGYRIN
jgi:hypothetical protein